MILLMPAPVLEVAELAHTYPDGTKAVQGVSFSVEPGEIVVIIGLSGAGKSTILRCINGIVRPTKAKIRFLDEQVRWDYGYLLQLRRRIGFIFQNFNILEKLTVLTNVLLGRLGVQPAWAMPLYRFSQRDREVATAALAKVGLLKEWHKCAGELSGGQQQRVGVARALAQEPRLLLADEPVSSLDPLTADRVLGHFVRICREEELATVINLHAVPLARKYADRVLGVRDGRIVFEGKPSQLELTILQNIYGEEYDE
ncbi:MAG: phosphonate ABC transporter ATP-binding protein [Planctomycetales bacterium 4484_113]|nr:MAG: phosphonate ABC transporter ATP-binding protein [Planctomycetales bacterium 4484_113]